MSGARSSRWRARRWPALAAALLVAALLTVEASGWTFLRGPIQRHAAERSGAPLQLDGDFRLHLLWNPGIEAGRLRVGSAPGFDAPLLADATQLRWHWRWGDVLRWWRGEPLRIESLEAATLVAHLQRRADGSANWQFGKARERQPGLAIAWPRFGLLRVGDGRIRLEDGIRGHDLLLEVRGGEGSAAAAQGGYDGRLSGHYRALPVDLALHAGGALPLLQDETTRTARVPLRAQGATGAARLDFDGVAASLITTQQLDGALHFSGPSLAVVGAPVGLTLPHTPPFDIVGRLGHAGTVWTLRADRAAIGRSLLNGNFAYDNKRRPKSLSGRLGGRLLLEDLGPAVGTNGPNQPRPSDRVLPQRRFDLPSLHTMDADIAIALDRLDFGGSALTPLDGLATQLRLHGGVLRLDALQARVAGGRIGGSSVYDTHEPPARWTVDLAFADIDLAGWVRRLQKQHDAQQARSYVTGTLTARLQLHGRGASTAEILSTLDGRVQARLANGTMSHLLTEVAGLDVAQALGVAIRGDRDLPLNCAAVDLTVVGGIVTPTRAVFDNRDSTIVIAGRIDLRDETLALKAAARPKDITPFSLRTPVTVGGTLSHPTVGVEAAPLAARALAAIGLGIVAGPAALLPFVDIGSRLGGKGAGEQGC